MFFTHDSAQFTALKLTNHAEIMEPSEENMKTLMSMGFADVTQMKRALRLAKNDVNEAVAILTNEQPGGSYDTLDEVEMKDLGKGNKTDDGRSAPDPPPPSYDEAVEPVEVRLDMSDE